jgi:hypothetical protein
MGQKLEMLIWGTRVRRGKWRDTRLSAESPMTVVPALKQQQQVPFRSKPSGEVLTLAARQHGLDQTGQMAWMSLFSSYSAYLV